MDTVVPTIPDVTADDIERKMPYPTLTKFEDAPTYSTMSTIRKEMFHNSIAVKSTFRRVRQGHYGFLQNPATYLIEVGEPRTFPTTGDV